MRYFLENKLRPNREKREQMQDYVLRRIKEMKVQDQEDKKVRTKDERMTAAFTEWREKNGAGVVHTTYSAGDHKEPKKARERKKSGTSK